jgi:hypothetical protein
VLDAIHKLMVQLRQLKMKPGFEPWLISVQLKTKYDMTQRYIKIEVAAKGIPQVEDLILTPCQCRTLDDLN